MSKRKVKMSRNEELAKVFKAAGDGVNPFPGGGAVSRDYHDPNLTAARMFWSIADMYSKLAKQEKSDVRGKKAN